MIHKIQNILSKPYRTLNTVWRRILDSILFGFFVFIFLFIFQPFGLGNLPGNIFLITLGYGGVTTISMLGLNVLIPILLSSFFSEDKWNIGRELFWSIVNVLTIGFMNTLFTHLLGFIRFEVEIIFLFEFYTLAVAFFPILISVLISQSKLEQKFNNLSQELNKQLRVADKIRAEKEKITIDSDNKNESLHLLQKDLLFIKSSDNYVKIFYLQDSKIVTCLLRNTLRSIDEDLRSVSNIFRCHKSYIINLDNVHHISGNAQGYKLHVKYSDYKVPVSRKFNNTIKERLSI